MKGLEGCYGEADGGGPLGRGKCWVVLKGVWGRRGAWVLLQGLGRGEGMGVGGLGKEGLCGYRVEVYECCREWGFLVVDIARLW